MINSALMAPTAEVSSLGRFSSCTSVVRVIFHILPRVWNRGILGRGQNPFSLSYHPKPYTQFYALVVSKSVPYTQFFNTGSVALCSSQLHECTAANTRFAYFSESPHRQHKRTWCSILEPAHTPPIHVLLCQTRNPKGTKKQLKVWEKHEKEKKKFWKRLCGERENGTWFGEFEGNSGFVEQQSSVFDIGTQQGATSVELVLHFLG